MGNRLDFTFLRHGERDLEGNLLESGRKSARKKGREYALFMKAIKEGRNIGNLVVEPYHSKNKRAVITAEEICDGIEEVLGQDVTVKPLAKDKRLYFPPEVATPQINEEFNRIWTSQGYEPAIRWWLKECEAPLRNWASYWVEQTERVHQVPENTHLKKLYITHGGLLETMASILTGQALDKIKPLGYLEGINVGYENNNGQITFDEIRSS